MTNCHKMKNGEIYVCKDCGLELKVVNECCDVGKPAEACECQHDGTPCVITCCGESLLKKE